MQTKEVMEEDIRKAEKLEVERGDVFPGHALFRERSFTGGPKKTNGPLTALITRRSVQSKTIISYPGLSNKELNWIIKRANLSFYFSLRFL